MTVIELDPAQAPTGDQQPQRRIVAGLVAAAAAVGVGFGVLVSMWLAPHNPAPATHHVVIAWTGGDAYGGFAGATNEATLHNGVQMLVEAGTTATVLVVGASDGAEPTCQISVDGQPPVTSNGFGLGAVAACTYQIKK